MLCQSLVVDLVLSKWSVRHLVHAKKSWLFDLIIFWPVQNIHGDIWSMPKDTWYLIPSKTFLAWTKHAHGHFVNNELSRTFWHGPNILRMFWIGSNICSPHGESDLMIYDRCSSGFLLLFVWKLCWRFECVPRLEMFWAYLSHL